MLYLILILPFLQNCSNNIPTPEKNDHFLFESDLETIVTNQNKEVFSTSNSEYILGGADMVSEDFARSGTHSLRLDSVYKYGLNCSVDHLDQNQFVSVSVWIHKSSINASLRVTFISENGEKSHQGEYLTVDNKSDWSLQTVAFMIPPDVQSISAYVYSGRTIAYFDDFSFHLYPSAPDNKLKTELNLFIPDSAQQTLNSYISKALKNHMIPADCKEYVTGIMLINQDSAAMDIKLKGDWTDHLRSGKESFRIKIKDDFAFMGLKNFSIQHAKARNYLSEWLIHKVAKREDILTTTYDFINVKINNDFKGVYALEEHFDKQLLESRKRREGPILKFDESAYWAGIEVFSNVDSLRQLPYFEQSTVSVFKKNRTRKSPALNKQFRDASNLLQLFKNGHLNVEGLFDIDQLARFYALMEISGGWHALRWHNRRFYFNPITQKLEHIAYDILPMNNLHTFENSFSEKLKAPKMLREISFDNMLLYDQKFKEQYLTHLERMTEKSYLDSIFKDLDNDLEHYLSAIKGETSSYAFNKAVFYENAAFLKSEIPQLKVLWDLKISENKYEDWIKPVSYNSRKDDLFIKEISINAFLSKKDSTYEIYLENFHLNEVNVLGYQIKESEKRDIWLDAPIRLNGFKTKADVQHFTSFFAPKKVYFTAVNNPSDTIKKKVIPWPKPSGISTRLELESAFDLSHSIFNVKGDEIIFSNQVIIDRIIAIPSRYSVTILPGTQIQFQNGGGLIVSNNLVAKGNKDQPIHLFCTDSTSNGITVLQADKAVFEYVNINGLSNLNHKNWELSGALTIYETTTTMAHCKLSNNQSEDALNIVRSEFNIDDLTISHTQSDGLDLDFCQGLIENSHFSYTGNDGVDISGSIVTIINSSISNTQDKAISAGEASKLTLERIEIINVEIGLAAKDASEITGQQIVLLKAKIACAAFQKKPEYGGSTIDLKEVKIKESIHKTIIQKGSVITLNGKKLEGELVIDIAAAYAQFY